MPLNYGQMQNVMNSGYLFWWFRFFKLQLSALYVRDLHQNDIIKDLNLHQNDIN